MAFTTLQDLGTALRQQVLFRKTSIANVGSTQWHSTSISNTGFPAAIGTLAVTASGAVPVSGDTGFPVLAPFSGTGRLVSVEYHTVIGARIMVYDRLFHCGEYAFNTANTTLASQPSFSGRLPGGNYEGTTLFVEAISTLGIGTSSTVTITYTDQAGNTGHTTSMTVSGTGGSTGTNRWFPMPLQSGDCGVQTIESVVSTGTQTTKFNVVIARPLWIGRAEAGYLPKLDPLDLLGAPIVYSTSALAIAFNLDAAGQTVAGTEICLEIASN